MKKGPPRCMAFVVMAGVFLCALSLRGGACAVEVAADRPLRVVTTLFPLYDWAGVIGGGKAEVSLLLPPGVEPHSFEPTPRDIAAINRADLLIYTGEFMEPWVQDILGGLGSRRPLAVDTSLGIQLMGGDEGAGPAHSEEPKARLEDEHARPHQAGGGREARAGGAKGHVHGGADPHIWLEFGNAQKMVDRIAAAFAEKDPAHGRLYLDRAREYNERLKALDADFEKTLAQCRHRTIIYGGHFTFGYFARRYGLDYVSPYSGFSPDAEPTPRRIAELIGNMKRLDVKAVFYEENIEPRIARIIREETGAQMLLLHGAHNVTKDELAGGASYLSIMEGNLERLKQGLECR